MKLYNTLGRKLEEFKPIKPGEVGIYSCGPTVYWNQHIGHMYAYVQWDVLVRALEYLGFKVNWVMNVTDVGHMTSDEDAGEDKMEKGAKREGVSVWDLANKYIAQFEDSIRLLNIETPKIVRATEHIPEQIALIEKIQKNGFAYETKTGVVFDTGKYPDYGKFANIDFSKQKSEERQEADPQKRNPWDFFLWVTGQPNHIMKWPSPWGEGFPGWHIECTAMSTKYLGDHFDIHTGGVDHIPVHHTNEIAQSYAAFGKPSANYWLHNSHLLGKGGVKMSKSLGNFVTVQELVEKGYDPLALRYFILNSQYRTGANFSWEALDAATTSLEKLRRRAQSLGDGESYEQEFKEAISDDLNMPKALAVAWKTESRTALEKFDEVLGLRLFETKEIVIPEDIKELMAKREKLRVEKKFAEADKIREDIERRGFKVEDKKA